MFLDPSSYISINDKTNKPTSNDKSERAQQPTGAEPQDSQLGAGQTPSRPSHGAAPAPQAHQNAQYLSQVAPQVVSPSHPDGATERCRSVSSTSDYNRFHSLRTRSRGEASMRQSDPGGRSAVVLRLEQVSCSSPSSAAPNTPAADTKLYCPGGGHVPLPTADRAQVTGSRRGAHRGAPGGNP